MSGRVVWALSIGFLGGVFLRSAAFFGWPAALLTAVIGLFALCYWFFDRKRAYVLVAIACIAVSLGIARMESALITADSTLAARIGSKVVLEGFVAAEPDVRERNERLTLRVSALRDGSTGIPTEALVLVIAPAHSGIAYGDAIRASGTLRTPEAFDTGAGRVFDYPMFLAKDGILFELAFAEVESTGENRGNLLKRAVLFVKHRYLEGLGRVLPEPAAGLAGGITVGDKRSIGEELAGTFQSVSLIHIVVLSGYNMTVVINAAAHVLAFVPRYGQFVLSSTIVGIFILMTGGAASATRAGAMALLATYARLSGRTYLALRVLLVVACAMVLWNPFVLMFDPGFQLSILATAGLVMFTPHIASRLSLVPERFALREIAASTIGTQVAVLPLLLYQNGLLSFVALPANLLALAVVPAAMLASFFAALFGMVFGSFGVVFALPALVLLSYLIAVAEFFARLPHAAVAVPTFSAWLLFLVYACIAVAYLAIRKWPGRPRPKGAE